MTRQTLGEQDILPSRQNLILSLTQEIFIKNVIIVKEPSFVVTRKSLEFAKFLSRSDIKFSFLPFENIKSLMIDYNIVQTVFSKTLI